MRASVNKTTLSPYTMQQAVDFWVDGMAFPYQESDWWDLQDKCNSGTQTSSE